MADKDNKIPDIEKLPTSTIKTCARVRWRRKSFVEENHRNRERSEAGQRWRAGHAA